jgi:hypothetical protein
MAKVILVGLLPPEHPVYKEGWSIAVQPPKAAPTPVKQKPAKPQKK